MKTRYRDIALPDLVHAARSESQPGHDHAFDEIVRRFRANAEASAFRLLRDTHLAQDVAQEAFLDAFLGLNRLREPAAFPGWFRRIVFKHADRIRRRPQLVLCELGVAEAVPFDAADPEATIAERESASRVRRELAQLPEHERVVVALFYFAQQSHSEIGERLNLPVSTVKKRLHDARQRLRIPLDLSESQGMVESSPETQPPSAPLADQAMPHESQASSLTENAGRNDRATPSDSTLSAPQLPARGLGGRDALHLVTTGTREAHTALSRFEPEQVAGAIQELSPRDRVAFLELSERLPEIVGCLPEITLTQTIRSVGIEDAGWLVEFTSPDQRIAAVDLDCWRDGHLSPSRLFQWIDALIEAGTETLLAAFDDLDPELWILALRQMADFSIPGQSDDGTSEDGWAGDGASGAEGLTDDGVVFYEPIYPDCEDRIREILNTARLYTPSLYWDFVYGAIHEPTSSCEAAAARWQQGRLNDLGFPDRRHAMAVYQPLRVESIPAVESLSAPPAEETCVPDILASTAIGRAISALPSERASEIQSRLFTLANAIAVADRLPLGSAGALEHALGKALEGVDRGLGALASARHRSFAEVADTTSARDLFRIGITLNPELHPQPTLGELEDFEADLEELDWDVPYEWLSEEDGTLDASGRPKQRTP